jgi:hypothetical protein
VAAAFVREGWVVMTKLSRGVSACISVIFMLSGAASLAAATASFNIFKRSSISRPAHRTPAFTAKAASWCYLLPLATSDRSQFRSSIASSVQSPVLKFPFFFRGVPPGFTHRANGIACGPVWPGVGRGCRRAFLHHTGAPA